MALVASRENYSVIFEKSALAYDLGQRWLGGARYVFYSGVPARVVAPEFYSSIPRAPATHRVDLRMEKRWLGATADDWWALVFEVYNATLSKDILDYRCDEAGCEANTIGPIVLPSIGVEAVF